MNATGIIKLGRPQADELGYVSSIDVREIGGTKCVVVQQNDATSRVATVILRGSTENVMDDVERAVDDGVNAYKALSKDSRTLPSGGGRRLNSRTGSRRLVASRLASISTPSRSSRGLWK